MPHFVLPFFGFFRDIASGIVWTAFMHGLAHWTVGELSVLIGLLLRLFF